MIKILCIAGLECWPSEKQRRAPANRLRPAATIHTYTGRRRNDMLTIEITMEDGIVYGATGHYSIYGTPLTNEISKSYIRGVSIKECIADLNETIDCFRKAEELKQRLGVI